MLRNLFRSRPIRHVGDPLYAHAVEQARQPGFYTTFGVDDRIDARFELYTLHVLLLILRLRDESEAGAEAAQSLFDVYVSALDNTLRELGVGDISMSKKMRKLGESLYGRMTAYEGPIRAGNAEALAGPLARNVHASDDAAVALPLARYAMAARAGLATQSQDQVVAGPTWPEMAP